MKTWQRLSIGFVVLLLVLSFTVYEQVLAGVAALLIMGIVIYGFILHPKRNVYYVRTTQEEFDPFDCESLQISHNIIAVRAEVRRLWLLFLPTFIALAFLIITASKGTTWHFSILNPFFNISAIGMIIFRFFLVFVFAILSTWINERRVMKDAEAVSANWIQQDGSDVTYTFIDQSDERYSGSIVTLNSIGSELSTLVFYSPQKPDLNKMSIGFIFHKFEIIEKGLPDLETAALPGHIAAELG